jgi:exodeoxyribonuclease-5
MQPSIQQDAALVEIDRWLKDRDTKQQVLKLAGPAGCGKTSIAKYAVQGAPGKAHFLAPTGKAADVLSRKGCPAKTIHSMAYSPKGERRSEKADQIRELLQAERSKSAPDENRLNVLRRALREASRDDGPIFAFNPTGPLSEPDVACIVVDEASMVNDTMRCDLLSYGVKILALYDPFQLPPVKGVGGFSGPPDIMLTEIHRQAAESGVLRFATAVREGRPLPLGEWGPDCSVIAQGDRDGMQAAALEADLTLCGKNDTRLALNRRLRQLRGLDSPHPMAGDRIICRRNEYEHEPVLFNGSMWRVTEADEPDTEAMLQWLSLDSVDVQGLSCMTQSLLHLFHGWDDVPIFRAKDGSKFDYAHAITTHLAQGSEARSVFVFDESARAFPGFPARHLYTAATRAREKLVVARP